MPLFTDTVYAFLSFSHETADYTVLSERMAATKQRIEASTRQSNEIDQQGIDVLEELRKKTEEGSRLAAQLDVSKSRAMQELAAGWNSHVRQLAELDTPIVLGKLVGAAGSEQTSKEALAAIAKISSDYDERTKRLRAERDAAQKELQAAKIVIQEREDELLTIQTEQARLESEATASKKTKKRIRAERDNAVQARDSAVQERDDNVQAVGEEHRKREELKLWALGVIGNLEDKVRTAENERSTLQGIINTLVEDSNITNTEAETKAAEHRAQLDELTTAHGQQIGSLQSDLKSAKDRNTGLGSELERLHTQLREQTDAQANAEDEAKREKTRADAAEKTIGTAEERAGAGEDKIREQEARTKESLRIETGRADVEKDRADKAEAKVIEFTKLANGAQLDAQQDKQRADTAESAVNKEKERADHAELKTMEETKRADNAQTQIQGLQTRTTKAEQDLIDESNRASAAERDQATRITTLETQLLSQTARAVAATTDLETEKSRATSAEQAERKRFAEFMGQLQLQTTQAKADLESEKSRASRLETAQTTLIATLEADLRTQIWRAIRVTNQRNTHARQIETDTAKFETDKIQLENEQVQLENNKVQLENDKVQLETVNWQLNTENEQLNTENMQLKTINGQLETSKAQLETEGGQLRTSNSQLETESRQLRTSNSQLETKNGQLRTSNSQLETESRQLRTSNSQLETKNGQLNTENTQLKTQNSQLETKGTQLKADKNQLEAAKTEAIADTAALQRQIDAAIDALEHSRSVFPQENTVRPSLATLTSAVIDFVFDTEKSALGALEIAGRVTKQASPPFPSAGAAARMLPTQQIDVVVAVFYELDNLIISLRDIHAADVNDLLDFAQAVMNFLTLNVHKHLQKHHIYSMKTDWWSRVAEQLVGIDSIEGRTELYQSTTQHDFMAQQDRVLTVDDVQAEKRELGRELDKLADTLRVRS